MSQHPLNPAKVFGDFLILPENEWSTLVQSTMSAPEFEKYMHGRSVEGLRIQPFYAASDFHHHLIENTSFSYRHFPGTWQFQEIVYFGETLSYQDANLQILRALEGGVESILIDLSTYQKAEPNLDKLLKGVYRDAIDISFNLGNAAFMPNKQSLSGMQGTLYMNPIETYMRQGKDFASALDKIGTLLEAGIPAYRCLPVSGYIFANCGANVIEEVALSCNLLMEYLDHFTEKGFNAQQLFENLELTLSTRSPYLADIAKFRAIPILLEKIMASYAVKLQEAPPLRAVSAVYNKADYDLNTNLLRNSTEAMAALLGNCNKVCLIPHNGKKWQDNEFGRRMARNISHLLRYESHFGLVQDPLRGAYALESLTSSIVEQAWALFQQVEAEGGLLTFFRSGKLQIKLGTSAAAYLDGLMRLRKTAVGANRYVPAEPVLSAKDHFTQQNLSDHELPLLTEIRGPAMIEGIRKLVDQEVGHGKRRPLVGIVALSEISTVAVVSLRAAFVEDVLTSIGAGVTRISGHLMADNITAMKLSALVLVGDDDEYHALQADEFRARLQNLSMPIVLSGYPKNIVQAMHSYGVDAFMYTGMDVPAFAEQLYQKLKFFEI